MTTENHQNSCTCKPATQSDRCCGPTAARTEVSCCCGPSCACGAACKCPSDCGCASGRD